MKKKGLSDEEITLLERLLAKVKNDDDDYDDDDYDDDDDDDDYDDDDDDYDDDDYDDDDESDFYSDTDRKDIAVIDIPEIDIHLPAHKVKIDLTDRDYLMDIDKIIDSFETVEDIAQEEGGWILREFLIDGSNQPTELQTLAHKCNLGGICLSIGMILRMQIRKQIQDAYDKLNQDD